VELQTKHAELQTAREELEALRAAIEAQPAAPLTAAAVNGAAASSAEPSASSASLVAVQRRVADLISDSASLESAMRSGLAAFGELAGWDAAVGWLLARDGAWLRPASVWCSQFVAGSTFDTQTWQAILDDGPRAIAAAWEATEPVWIEDAGEEEDRPRCRWARAAGLTTAVAVPVLVDGERRGMIEVYRRDRGAHDEEVLAVLETIATQLGSIERLLELADRPRWR
jgi:transcriptional regulator with GAF, ATPase, and Fis domain